MKTGNRYSTTTLVIGGTVAAAVIGLIAMVATRGDDEPADAAGPVGVRDPAAERRDEALNKKLDDLQARVDKLSQNPAIAGGNPSNTLAAPSPSVPEDKLVFAIPITGDPVRGEPEALVTVVRASEYMCPFCARSRDSFERVLAEYPHDVRIVHKDMAHIHAEGPMLAAAACAAHRQGKFWEMDAQLWEAFEAKNVASDHVEDLARRLGLDMSEYENDIDHWCTGEIAADERVFRDLGISGVPAYFVNGRLIRGAQPYNRFKELVDEELALARRRVASGASRATYYEEWVVAKGLTTYQTPSPSPSPTPSPTTRPRRAEPDRNAVYGVPIAGDPIKGRADALVTIVRAGEYACPFCDKVRPTLDQILRDYPDTVRIVYKDFIVHPQLATDAAKAACAAHRQDRFWAMDELIWEKAFKARRFDAANMEELAREARLDMRRYRADLASCGDEVNADMATLTKFGVGATPTFFINGRYMSGAQPYDAFKTLIDEELAKARHAVAQGTSRSRYYDENVVGRGLADFTPPPPLAEAPAP